MTRYKIRIRVSVWKRQNCEDLPIDLDRSWHFDSLLELVVLGHHQNGDEELTASSISHVKKHWQEEGRIALETEQ